MSFYQDLTSYYDEIFPLNQTAFSFISPFFQKGDSVLDIGAGTGNMAIALAQAELIVTASEPEERMAEAIRKKANSNMPVHTKSMEEIGEFAESFDGILCIGNTLPHLSNTEAIEAFLEKCYEKLNVNGTLILQQVNYDKVLTQDDFPFPTIEKDHFTFTRHYEKKDDHILFTSRVTANGESIENTIPLFPITSEQLISLLKKVGFQPVDTMETLKVSLTPLRHQP